MCGASAQAKWRGGARGLASGEQRGERAEMMTMLTKRRRLRRIWSVVAMAFALGWLVAAAARGEELVVTDTTWHGFKRVDFVVGGRPALLVLPKTPAPGKPWIWRTEFFEHEPQADLALLERGWHVAYVNAKNMYGAPRALVIFDTFFEHVTRNYGLARRVVMEGLSRGGLYAFNYAVAHPERVAAMYLDAPVLNVHSWPGRSKDTPAGAKLWKEFRDSYGLTEEQAQNFRDSPIDHIETVAQAGIPILLISGDADETVPFPDNGGILQQHYKELGGMCEVIIKPGGKHHPHSLVDPTPIVDFITKNARF
jgi:pimeloyl-ACP methyl ester carboxylesterase